MSGGASAAGLQPSSSASTGGRCSGDDHMTPPVAVLDRGLINHSRLLASLDILDTVGRYSSFNYTYLTLHGC